jgi:hypothetical protein
MLRRASIQFEETLFHPPSHRTATARASYAGGSGANSLSFSSHRGLTGRFLRFDVHLASLE